MALPGDPIPVNQTLDIATDSGQYGAAVMKTAQFVAGPAADQITMPDLSALTAEQRAKGISVVIKQESPSTTQWRMIAQLGDTIEDPAGVLAPAATMDVGGAYALYSWEYAADVALWRIRYSHNPQPAAELDGTYFDLDHADWGTLLSAENYVLIGTGEEFSNAPPSWTKNDLSLYVVTVDVLNGNGIYSEQMRIANLDSTDDDSNSLIYMRTGSTFAAAVALGWDQLWRSFDVMKYQGLNAWSATIDGNGAADPTLSVPSYNIASVTRLSVGVYEYALVQTQMFGVPIENRTFPNSPGFVIQSSVVSDAYIVSFVPGATGLFQIHVKALILGQGNKFEAVPYDIVAGDAISTSASLYLGDGKLPPQDA